MNSSFPFATRSYPRLLKALSSKLMGLSLRRDADDGCQTCRPSRPKSAARPPASAQRNSLSSANLSGLYARCDKKQSLADPDCFELKRACRVSSLDEMSCEKRRKSASGIRFNESTVFSRASESVVFCDDVGKCSRIESFRAINNPLREQDPNPYNTVLYS